MWKHTAMYLIQYNRLSKFSFAVYIFDCYWWYFFHYIRIYCQTQYTGELMFSYKKFILYAFVYFDMIPFLNFCVCTCAYTSTCHNTHVEVRGQLSRINSFLLSRLWRLNRKVLWFAEPSLLCVMCWAAGTGQRTEQDVHGQNKRKHWVQI